MPRSPFDTRDFHERIYTDSEVCDLLEKARELGFSLDRGSDLEKLTTHELDVLVNQRQ